MALFAFLVASLGIYLVQQPARAECRIPQSSMTCGRQPGRGASIHRPVWCRILPSPMPCRMATFGPLFAWGASGDFLPAIIELLFVWTGSVFPLQKFDVR